ncbi:PucR family transcriptional regulator [Pseudonocardia sp.]|uniref:PucR family transcriptional regulator n=1 Tax=Pseudonocardia sp. TaxID=60912 RepID=UPI003D136B5C
MPATLDDLISDRSLGLRPACPSADLDREVSWAHSSELTDPTRYLDGGELLLTTGLPIRATDPDVYVRRLAAHGLAGLGFGVGLGWPTVPAALAEACEHARLPLLEVPERTPFIAITKAVSAALASDAYTQVVRSDDAQRALTAAAVAGSGTGGVLRTLAGLLGAWAIVVDATHTVRHAAPRGAGRRAAGLRGEIRRVLARRGSTSSTISDDDGHVVLQTLRLPGRGLLAVGRETPFSPVDKQVIGSAVSVLTLLHARGDAVARAERALRCALLELMVTVPGPGAADIAEPLWGRPPGAGGHAVALRRRDGRTDELLDALEGRDRKPPFAAARGDAVVVLVETGEPDAILRAAAGRPDVHAGVSDPIVDDPAPGAATPGRTPVGQAVDQAVHALDAAHRRHLPVVHFGELAGAGLHRLVPAGDAAGFAESLLRPLVRHDEHRRGELVESVRAWLAHHGQWDPAAAALGVHRHTLRTRIDKAARLLGRDLDSPGVRAELWFALQV